MSGKTLKGRFLSVDILRGMTVCFMIIVNNGAGKSFPFLRHAQWNGMTPCDMVFPFFLFIMGVSVALASPKSIGKILRSSWSAGASSGSDACSAVTGFRSIISV